MQTVLLESINSGQMEALRKPEVPVFGFEGDEMQAVLADLLERTPMEDVERGFLARRPSILAPLAGGGSGLPPIDNDGGGNWSHNEGEPSPVNGSRGIFGKLGGSVLIFVLRDPRKRVLNETPSPSMSEHFKSDK